MAENEISVGYSQTTAGANGLITSAVCNGLPSVVATAANTFAVGATLYQRDSSTGYVTVVWQNTGTAAVPAWTAVVNQKVISGSGATVALTAAQSGSLVLMDRAAGIVFTLPAPAVGLNFTFKVLTSVTSNAYKIITSGASIFLMGSIVNIKTDLTTLFSIADGTTIVSISMNGTTTGGLLGSQFKLTCISLTEWIIEGANLASGSIATPFATS